MAHSRMCAPSTAVAVGINGKGPAASGVVGGGVITNNNNNNNSISNNGPGLLVAGPLQTKEKPSPMKNSNGGTPAKMHNVNNKRMAEPMNGEYGDN